MNYIKYLTSLTPCILGLTTRFLDYRFSVINPN